MPKTIGSLDDWRRWVDGYDVGIKYTDDHIRQVLEVLEEEGVLEETGIIISSDHGENQGELNFYGDHHTGDFVTSRVPLIVRLPGLTDQQKGWVDRALHYQFDFAATLLELLGIPVPARWDAQSFAQAFREGREEGRDFLVCSQMAYLCQRCVLFERWALLRTYHAQFSDFPPTMLFDVVEDPHELKDLAPERPEVVDRGLARLQEWVDGMLATALEPIDPMRIVLREGGPWNTRRDWPLYRERLRAMGREKWAEVLERRLGGKLEG